MILEGQEKEMQPHSVVLKERKSLTATGVSEVISYDEHTAVIETLCGILEIGGNRLHVHEISTRTGELSVEGEVDYLRYEAKKEEGEGGFWKRLMR